MRKTAAKGSETSIAIAENANISSTCDLMTAVVESESVDFLSSANENRKSSEEQVSVEELKHIISDQNFEIKRQKDEIREITTLLANLKSEMEELKSQHCITGKSF